MFYYSLRYREAPKTVCPFAIFRNMPSIGVVKMLLDLERWEEVGDV